MTLTKDTRTELSETRLIAFLSKEGLSHDDAQKEIRKRWDYIEQAYSQGLSNYDIAQNIAQEVIPKKLILIHDLPGKYENAIVVNLHLRNANEYIWTPTNAIAGPVLRVPCFFAPTRAEILELLQEAEVKAVKQGFDFYLSYVGKHPEGFVGQLIVTD